MIDLNEFDIIILNSSGGKDSLVMLWEVHRLALLQNYPIKQVVVSHQDLGEAEWQGTKKLVGQQAELFGFNVTYSKRRNKKGYNETLLEYVTRRGKWPSNAQRYCTSDFKRGPGSRVVTALTKELEYSKVLYCFGFRKNESPSRKKKKPFIVNKKLTTKKRKVYDWLPIHDWESNKVWSIIKKHKLPYHVAYDLGMPRLSCCFCIFSPFDALVIAGKSNPKLLEKYVEVEKKIDHSFTQKVSLESVKQAIENNYTPNEVRDWLM